MYSFRSNIQKLLPKPAMTSKVGSFAAPSYEDFEPYCNWRRERGGDTLVIRVADFKMDELKVHISSRRVLKVGGKRGVNGQGSSRFWKEIEIPGDCNTDGIRAKFSSGLLTIEMPKTASPTEQDHPKPGKESEENQKRKQESSQGQALKTLPIKEIAGASDDSASAGAKSGVMTKAAESKSGVSAAPKLEMDQKVVTGVVAVVVAVVLVLGACIACKCRSSGAGLRFLSL